MTPVRVVLADDHPVVRAGLAALLGSLPDIEVVGVAADGRSAVKEVVLQRPDVAMLDLQMPRARRVGGDPGDRPAGAGRRRPGPHHVRRRGFRLRGHASGRPRLRGQGRRAGGDRPGHPGRGRRRGHLLSRGGAAGAALLRHAPSRSPIRFPSSPHASGRSWICWRPHCPTPRSRPASACRRRRSPTICPRSSPSSRSPIGPRRSCALARRAWAAEDRKSVVRDSGRAAPW